MKKLLIAAIFALTTACTTHHAWMDKAYVGYVDQQADAGMRNGVKYYRPQFQSDCHYNKAYIDEQSSTGCAINEARIADLHLYSEHVAKESPTRADTQINHEFMDNAIGAISIEDNL
jgi:hypothetical protein